MNTRWIGARNASEPTAKQELDAPIDAFIRRLHELGWTSERLLKRFEEFKAEESGASLKTCYQS